MIANIDRFVRILDIDIASEEDRAQVSNPSDAAYPILARMLAARRDNLKAAAANLKQHPLEKGGALLLEEFNNL
jgi:hypothetical protein